MSHVLEGRGLSEYYRRVGTMETLHGLHDELRRLLQLFFQDRQFTKVYNVSVMQVLHYIHRHYSDLYVYLFGAGVFDPYVPFQSV